MNKLFKLLALTVCVLSGYISYAQSAMTVSGNVKDSEGLPIIGAVVMIEGQTSTGVITDADGNYTIKVPASSASKAVLNVCLL